MYIMRAVEIHIVINSRCMSSVRFMICHTMNGSGKYIGVGVGERRDAVMKTELYTHI